MGKASDEVWLGTAPARVGGNGRTLTVVEERALRGGASQVERADLIRAGWTFERLFRRGEVDEAVEGPMLTSARADLAMIDTSGPGKRSLAQLALWLAAAIDDRGDESGTSTMARLAQEFRATMVALTTQQAAGDQGEIKRLLGLISTPDAGKR